MSKNVFNIISYTGAMGPAGPPGVTGPPASNIITSVFNRTGAISGTTGDYNINQLSGVSLNNPVSGQILQYNGSNFVNIPNIGMPVQTQSSSFSAVKNTIYNVYGPNNITATLPDATGVNGGDRITFVLSMNGSFTLQCSPYGFFRCDNESSTGLGVSATPSSLITSISLMCSQQQGQIAWTPVFVESYWNTSDGNILGYYPRNIYNTDGTLTNTRTITIPSGDNFILSGGNVQINNTNITTLNPAIGANTLIGADTNGNLISCPVLYTRNSAHITLTTLNTLTSTTTNNCVNFYECLATNSACFCGTIYLGSNGNYQTPSYIWDLTTKYSASNNGSWIYVPPRLYGIILNGLSNEYVLEYMQTTANDLMLRLRMISYDGVPDNIIPAFATVIRHDSDTSSGTYTLPSQTPYTGTASTIVQNNHPSKSNQFFYGTSTPTVQTFTYNGQCYFKIKYFCNFTANTTGGYFSQLQLNANAIFTPITMNITSGNNYSVSFEDGAYSYGNLPFTYGNNSIGLSVGSYATVIYWSISIEYSY